MTEKIRKIFVFFAVVIMAATAFAINTDDVSAASAKYWLKVNKSQNVVNVYKQENGKWVEYKAMLCSTGNNGCTPSGNYTVKKKWRWQHLFHGVSGQYVTQFYGNYLFHSVVYDKYKSNSSCIRKEYNKLGKQASHGCVRLATMDAKWIYKNCGKGTKVTVYKSSTPGPFGKPAIVKMRGSGKRGWDPTDEAGKSTFAMTGPVIEINKNPEIESGAAFDLKEGIRAYSPYTFQDLTDSVKVDRVSFCREGSDEYVKLENASVDTSVPGRYKIRYSCYNSYCGKAKVHKDFVLTVLPPVQEEQTSEPISGDQVI